jgi:hypothetical protein
VLRTAEIVAKPVLSIRSTDASGQILKKICAANRFATFINDVNQGEHESVVAFPEVARFTLCLYKVLWLTLRVVSGLQKWIMP